MPSKPKPIPRPVRSDDVPVTATMLYGMEERIKHKIDASVHTLDGKISELRAELHRMALLAEEQKAQNRFTLDAYAQIYDMIKSSQAD